MRHVAGFCTFCLLVFLALTLHSTAMAQEWQRFSADDYGFAMLVPSGTTMKTEEFGGGWGGLVGESQGTTVIGIAKLGTEEKPADIEAFGVEVTKIAADRWTLIDEGSGKGWKWYRTVSAADGGKQIFGGYGTGPRGSYLLILVTTPDDFKAYRADFDTWYQSIELF